jgi:hypothetical protein
MERELLRAKGLLAEAEKPPEEEGAAKPAGGLPAAPKPGSYVPPSVRNRCEAAGVTPGGGAGGGAAPPVCSPLCFGNSTSNIAAGSGCSSSMFCTQAIVQCLSQAWLGA